MSGDGKEVWQGDGSPGKVAYTGGPNPGAQEKAGPLDPQGEGTGRHGDAHSGFWWGGTDKGEHNLEVSKDHDPLLKTGTGEQNDRRPDRSQEVTGSKVAPTNFFDYSINGLKKLVLNANPGHIDEARLHWVQVYEWLSGGEDGQSGVENGIQDVHKGDSIAGMLQKAVDNVCEHWEGQAATAFRLKAAEVVTSIGNAAQYAKLTAGQLEFAHKDLVDVQQKIADIEPPSKVGSALDFVSDGGEQNDKQAMEDLRKGVRADVVAAANEGSMSAGMEKKLQAVSLMEQLAANYTTYSRNLRNNSQMYDEGKEGISKPDGNVEPGVPITVPGPSTGGPGKLRTGNKPWSAGTTTSIKPAPAVPCDPGITGSPQPPAVPTAKTNVDSISPGLNGPGPSTGVGGPSAGGGGLGRFGTGGAQSPGILAAGEADGLAAGAVGRGGIGALGGRGGLAGGGGAAGRGAGGRAGMGGMGGVGGGVADRGGASAGGRGALAKARGGVVGAAKGVGKGTGGGAGLHGSRGGTQAGAAGAGGKGRRSEKEKSQGDRPDYLVEDEETWISEEDRNRNVPRTIE
jgi:hypothetical protein